MNTEKECRTCVHAAESMLEDPCKSCLKLSMSARQGPYPRWEPREDDE